MNAGGSTGSTANPQLTIKKIDQDNSKVMNGVNFEVYECELTGNTIHRVKPEKKTSGVTVDGIYKVASSYITNYNKIYEVKETKTPEGYIENESPYYIICIKKSSNENSEDVQKYIDYFEKQDKNRYKIAYSSTDFNLVVYNSQKGIVVKKAFINDAAGKSTNPVSGIYKFGLYENAQGNGDPIQTKTITYNAGDTQEKSVKFINLDLSKTYYVFEIGDDNKPIVDTSKEVTINKLQYTVDYKTEGESTNAATNGQTVTITNRSRTKILPSTGSYGTLIYRISGAMLVLASLIVLININKKNHLNEKSKNRRKQ